MNEQIRVYDPVATDSVATRLSRHPLDTLTGKVIGFVDNAKPNFQYLVDDLGALLMEKYGVAEVVKHRKRGQVPMGDAVADELAEKCDAIIAGSGD